MQHPLIARLNLSPHPEGGWFRETMRQPAPDLELAAPGWSPPV